MTIQEESDEQEIPSHALSGLLGDLDMSPPANPLPSAQAASWTFPTPLSRTSTPPYTSGSTASASTFPSNRAASREQSRSVPELDLTPTSAPSQLNTLFNTPNRSIFSSGPPTSSLSSSTAQASMSAPSPGNPSRPLSALTAPGSSRPGRSVHYSADAGLTSRKPRLSRAEKDVDDPSSPLDHHRSEEERDTSTQLALARLFNAPEALPPSVSRHASYTRPPSRPFYARSSTSDATPLPSHLYQRGLISGKHSDITVHAFGARYPLHRLLLDRAPFFESALSEPWFESSSRDITLHPEDIDSNITQHAFELALRRLYGCGTSAEEDREAIGLFATGCWLEMHDLIDSSISSLLCQMSCAKLAPLIKLVTSNYYGIAGDRLLASSKAMLCRDGWEMPLRYWDDISGEIIREIVGGDGFFVAGEWERWTLAKRLFDRRLKSRATEAGLIDEYGKLRHNRPYSMHFHAIRFDTVYRKTSSHDVRQIPEAYDAWLALYTHPDIAALLVLLDEGIHYVHLSFEQLQYIRDQKDFLGLPVMPEKVISNALWMSMELRQKVLNAKELDMELGMTQISEEHAVNADSANADPTKLHSINKEDVTSSSKGKQTQVNDTEDENDEMESGSWDGNGKPRKFWIPHTDSTSVMGGNPEMLASAHNPRPSLTTRHMNRFSASLDPQDVQWASDFTAIAGERPRTPGSRAPPPEPAQPLSYSHYPPFRFAAEFPSSRLLKERKRVYSRTVWYAGSLWNVYVQKVETTKNTQLGVYLHRAKEKEDDPNGAHVANNNSVDERIGHLERGLLLQRNGGRRSRRQQQAEARADPEGNTSGSGGDLEETLIGSVAAMGRDSRESTLRDTTINGLIRGSGLMKASQTPRNQDSEGVTGRIYEAGNSDSDDEIDELTTSSKKFSVSTLPPYVDGRPTIKTYFKIYTPSQSGRVLSVYESAPDRFNFSQSWGWKSSNMVLDDGILDSAEGLRGKDGRLRFMVVIGNV